LLDLADFDEAEDEEDAADGADLGLALEAGAFFFETTLQPLHEIS
jgi:hypothetical protein